MTTKEIIALILVILLVLGINSILFLALRGKPIRIREFEVFSRALHMFRHPFQEEEEDLEELSRRVSELRDPEQKIE